MAKILIEFLSRADENYFGGTMRCVKAGISWLPTTILNESPG